MRTSTETCHYCPAQAATRDHIVPRSRLVVVRRGQIGPLGQRFHTANTVPACHFCNAAKGQWRSDCACERCTWAWEKAIELDPSLVNVPVWERGTPGNRPKQQRDHAPVLACETWIQTRPRAARGETRQP